MSLFVPLLKLGEHKNPGASSSTELRKTFGSLVRGDTIGLRCRAIQIAMGWSDSHLHRFHIHGKDYGVAHEGGLTFSDDPEHVRL
jgi:Plasmid pRiA4b ORF-3-like protein